MSLHFFSTFYGAVTIISLAVGLAFTSPRFVAWLERQPWWW